VAKFDDDRPSDLRDWGKKTTKEIKKRQQQNGTAGQPPQLTGRP